jgi:alpha-ketoglutarate-dependent taurine dioxygenase
MSFSVQIQTSAGPMPFSVQRLQPALGAEISGIDLRQPLNRVVRDAIYDALLQYKVIFFRDQDISREQHIAFGRAFGELEVELVPHPNYPEILELKVDAKSKYALADIWHTDNAWRPIPSGPSVALAYTLPSLGGDTVFANAVAAYSGLDEETKAKIENLKAVHTVFHGNRTKNVDPDALEKLRACASPATHAVVRIHPDTGERILFVNERYTDYIVGLESCESAALLRHLTDQFRRPEYQLRFNWRVHTVAMWDNRSTQHYGVNDYNEPRHLERVTVSGTVPIGPTDIRQQHALPNLL